MYLKKLFRCQNVLTITLGTTIYEYILKKERIFYDSTAKNVNKGLLYILEMVWFAGMDSREYQNKRDAYIKFESICWKYYFSY